MPVQKTSRTRAAAGSGGRTPQPVIFLEPQADYDFLFELVRKDRRLRYCRFFIPRPAAMEAVRKAGLEHGQDLQKRIWPFSSMSIEHDDQIYGLSRSLAESFVGICRSCSAAVYGDPDHFISPYTVYAAEITMHDRFVAQLRPVMEFERHLQQEKAARVIYVPSPSSPSKIVFDLIERAANGIECEIYTDHLLRHKRSILHTTDDPLDLILKNPRQLPAYSINPDEIEKHSVFVVANVLDRQYENTFRPLLPKLLDRRPVVALSHTVSDAPPWLASNDTAESNPKSFQYYGKAINPQPIELLADDLVFMRQLVRRVAIATGLRPDVGAKYDKLISSFVARIVLPLLYYIKQQQKLIESLLPKVSCVVVIPGRTLDAIIVTGLCKRWKIPTIEIQSGTLSYQRRYIEPSSDDVLAIEPFSAGVYEKFLGKPAQNIFVTGSVKIEYDLQDARALTKDAARTQIEPLAALPGDARVLMLASQPVGLERALRIAEIAIKSCRGVDNLHLAIKPHPNETEKYLHGYRALAKKHKFERLLILQGAPVLPTVVASDVVATYYSTVGLEAFALNRDVICINPFDSPPPFNLVELGTAAEVKDAKTAAKLLCDSLAGQRIVTKSDPLLDRIRDGKAIERVRDHILLRAQEYQEWTTPWHPRYQARKLRSARLRFSALGQWARRRLRAIMPSSRPAGDGGPDSIVNRN